MNRLSIFGAIFATLASSACCVAPAMLAAIGFSGVGLSAFLMQYRPLFLGIGIAFLVTAVVSAFWRARVAVNAGPQGAAAAACCPPGATVASIEGGAPGPTVRSSNPSWFLWAVAMTAVVLAAYPYFASAFRGPAQAVSQSQAAAFMPASATEQPQQAAPEEGASCGQPSASPCACR